MQWLRNLFGGVVGAPAVALTPEQAASLEAWRKLPAEDFSRSHFLTRYVVADVEASGLHMVKDRLISIGAVAVNRGMIELEDAFEVVLRQDEVSSHDNILIHGIGGSAQREGMDPVDALLDFLHYIGKAPLVAYHALFDQTMIERAMSRYLGSTIALPWIDLAWVLPELYRERIDDQVGLDPWLASFGIENILRHNAVSDAYATAKLLQVAQTRGASLGKDSAEIFMDMEKARRWLRRAG
jgi:DNA polymerase-3 subunit epsilon